MYYSCFLKCLLFGAYWGVSIDLLNVIIVLFNEGRTVYRWFISFNHVKGSGFRIKDSPHDLDTSDGLLLMIQELEAEYNGNIVPLSWNRLDNNIGFDGDINIGYLEIIMRGLRAGGFCSVNFANGTKETLMDSIRYKSDGIISEGNLTVIAEMIISSSDILPDVIMDQLGSLPSERINKALKK